MAVEIKVPELGEDIKSGEVVSVPVAVGDSVSDGQTILEVEAGKASIEIPATGGGTIAALHVAQGDTVEPGQVVMEIEGGAAAPAEKAPEPEPEPEPVVEETPEPTPEPEPVVENPAPVVEEKPQTPNPKPQSPAAKALAVSAAPGVRRLARELGVDIHLVPPTGPAGYITAEDVKEFTKSGQSTGAPAGSPQTTRVEKMTPIRKATMNHMAHCWASIPHVTHHDTADITELEALRKRYAVKAESVGTKLTMTAMLIKVISSALKVHPKFNCSIDPEKGEIIYKEFFNIGIAMDTPKGLLVPVIRDADKKNMVELALELKNLAEKAREGKIDPADLKGGTFTFTNIGIIGGSFFTPIVNSPEVAILGSGRAYWESCPDGGEKKFKLPLSLSYDHRIIDGADGAKFLKWVIDAIEEPLLLSLEG
jgi:pyruvate dehydrogenase E2 component (dihydrolipoamide acetyltransferase)